MLDPNAPLVVQNLNSLSPSHRAQLGELRVSEPQEFFGGSFAESLEAWQIGPSGHVLGLCFLVEDQPVGMTLFKLPPQSPDWVSADAASIHGLKIATPWQGRGWGKTAFRLAIDRLAIQWPSAKTLMLAVDAENAAALKVYKGFGMTDSGPVFKGNHGLEHRMSVSLSQAS